MDKATLADKAAELATGLEKLAQQAGDLAHSATQVVVATGDTAAASGGADFLSMFTIFVMACFVGYHVVWNVTPALHSPLMGVTNAISSVIIVGGLLAVGPALVDFSKVMGFFAVLLASINIFGGFIVTQRMLAMFKKKQR
ncbi:MAG: NAD(P) transhydrogenase subunit alpha [Rhodospirillales bacterium]|tara:strand:+ start:39 stop:461 length:423 start_codon:yes stop_codon:yes gene_type:complete